MRAWLAWALLLAACGKTTVADRIDALRKAGVDVNLYELPSAQRMEELYPDRDVRSLRPHGAGRTLRAHAAGAAILEAGPAAVPELVALLEDPERAKLAALFLGEIGGSEAALGLLARWRELRGTLQDMSVYRRRDGEIWAGGVRREGPFVDFYGALLHALCHVGREVGAEVAADTAAAMDEAERIQLAGGNVIFEERRDEPEGEVTLRWQVEPIEAAEEGLYVLAMAGAREGVDVFVRALRSPVRSIRWKAIQGVGWLGEGMDRTLPILGALLDDPEWRSMALEAVAFMVARDVVPRSLSPAEEEALAVRYKRRLQELGHLPR